MGTYNRNYRGNPYNRGDLIFWKDLLDQVRGLNVLRYGNSYEIHLGANLALRDVESLIEKAPRTSLSKSRSYWLTIQKDGEYKIFCRVCGSEEPEKRRFCPECGSEMENGGDRL